MVSVNHFGVWDYIVVAGTLIFSLLIGVYYAVFSKQTKEDFLMGSRELNVFAISASMIVTYLSAITVLGYPSEIYAHGVQIFMMTLLAVVFVPLAIYFFVSVFYKLKLTSVYEYLEMRYDSKIVRLLMASTFIVQSCIITGIMLYAPSIALERILGLPVWISIVSVGLCGTVYTSIGGYKAVIFTDVFQFFMIIIGMLGIVIKGFITSGGVLNAFRIAGDHGRLNLIDLTIDPFMRHNTLNFVLGTGFNLIVFYGTAQAHVQRYCSLPTFERAVKAIFLSVVLKILTLILVVFTGVAIFATFVGCDPILLGHITKADQIVPHFVVTQLAFIPGIMGLFVACIFSAVLRSGPEHRVNIAGHKKALGLLLRPTSISSTLNCLSAVTWEDFLSHIPAMKNLSGQGQTNVARLMSFLYGGICIGMAMAFAAQRGTMVFQLTMSAVGAFSGPMGGVFVLAMFVPVSNKWGTFIGMLVGLTAMKFVTIMSFFINKPNDAPLPTFINDCPAGTNMSLASILTPNNDTTLANLLHNAAFVPDIEWPAKLFTLSYILYPFVGALITVTFGVIFSFMTGGWSDAKKVNPKYLHPVLQKCGCCRMNRNIDDPALNPSPSETYKRADRLSELYADPHLSNPHLSNPNLHHNAYRYEPVPVEIYKKPT